MVVWGVVDCKAKVVVNTDPNFKKTLGVYIYRNHVEGEIKT